jgi:hypothetical protein
LQKKKITEKWQPAAGAREVMTIAYRAVEEKYADAALSGQFLLRRLSYYRSLECPPERRDELEASVRAKVDRWHIKSYDDSSKQTRESLRAMGVHVAPGVTMRNVSFNNVNSVQIGQDNFVLCFSTFPGANLSAGGRDVLLKISDVEELGKLLTEAQQADVHPFKCGRVQYGPRSFDPREAFMEPDPFIKEARFADENEVRLIARPMDDRVTLLTNCKRARSLIERVNWP